MSNEQGEARVTAFEKDLADLYAKHLLVIASCGGCWITPVEDETEAREWAVARRERLPLSGG